MKKCKHNWVAYKTTHINSNLNTHGNYVIQQASVLEEIVCAECLVIRNIEVGVDKATPSSKYHWNKHASWFHKTMTRLGCFLYGHSGQFGGMCMNCHKQLD